MIRPFTLVALAASAVMVGCNAPRKAQVTRYKTLDTLTVSARNNPAEQYRETTPRIWDILYSDVALRFDFEKKEAFGKARLRVKPYTVPADTLVLDAKGMDIESVMYAKNGEANLAFMEPLRYTYDSAQLKIAVKGLFRAGKTEEFVLQYTAKPYRGSTGGSAAITSDRGLYFINTDHRIPGKPAQVWTQGETESNSRWLPTIDKPNQRTIFSLHLTVPDTMQTLSNGRLVHSQTMNGMRTDDWTMDKPVQVYALMFAIGRFEKTTEAWHDAAGMAHDVRYYTEPQYTPFAKAMFANTPEMIECFSRTTGVTYPWDTYSQIVVRDYVSGAMENTSASLFGEFANRNFRQLADNTNEDVVSHELFHQWFGDYVTAESWSNLTLNESFATYGQQIWRKYKRGAASADELAWGDLSRYLESSTRSDAPLVRYYYRDKEEMFDRVSYQKGGAILRYINSICGDTLFNRAMNLYLSRNALHSAEASQWRLALEEATGRDWTPFFNEWYYRGGHPVLRIGYDYNDVTRKVVVTVRQAGAPDSLQKYRLPLKAEIISGNEHKVVDWLIKDRTQSFTYDYDGTTRPLVIPDAQHVLPGTIREQGKSLSLWLQQMRESDNFITKRIALDAALAAASEPVSVQIVTLALQDKYAGIRTAAFNGLARIKGTTWRDALRTEVVYAAEHETNNLTRAAAIQVLRSWNVRTAMSALRDAVNDSSYAVAGAALLTLTDMSPDTAYLLAKVLQQQQPKVDLYTAVWTAIGKHGDGGDILLFEKEGARVWGGEKIVLAASLLQYAQAVKDDEVLRQALALLRKMAASEESKNNRYYIGSYMLQLVQGYRSDAKSRTEKSARAAARQLIAEAAMKDMLSAETDPEVIKQLKEDAAEN